MCARWLVVPKGANAKKEHGVAEAESCGAGTEMFLEAATRPTRILHGCERALSEWTWLSRLLCDVVLWVVSRRAVAPGWIKRLSSVLLT